MLVPFNYARLNNWFAINKPVSINQEIITNSQKTHILLQLSEAY